MRGNPDPDGGTSRSPARPGAGATATVELDLYGAETRGGLKRFQSTGTFPGSRSAAKLNPDRDFDPVEIDQALAGFKEGSQAVSPKPIAIAAGVQPVVEQLLALGACRIDKGGGKDRARQGPALAARRAIAR